MNPMRTGQHVLGHKIEPKLADVRYTFNAVNYNTFLPFPKCLSNTDTFYQSAAAVDHHVPAFELLPRSRRAAANANATNTGATLEANNAPTLVITHTAAVTPTPPPADVSAQGVAAAVSRLTPLYPAPRPLLGANGTGIRWDVSSSTSSTTTQKPTVVSEPIDSDEATIQRVVDNVDVPSNEDEAEAVAKAHNFTIQHREVSGIFEQSSGVTKKLPRIII